MDVRCDREGSGSRFGIGPVDRPGLRRWLESRWTGLISAAVAGVVAAGFGGVALVAPAVAGPRAPVVGGTRAAQGEFPWMVPTATRGIGISVTRRVGPRAVRMSRRGSSRATT